MLEDVGMVVPKITETRCTIQTKAGDRYSMHNNMRNPISLHLQFLKGLRMLLWLHAIIDLLPLPEWCTLFL